MLQQFIRRLVIGGAALSVFGALPAFGQVINEDLQIDPSDGQGGDVFGTPIALENGILAVGASWDDDNSLDSGSRRISSMSPPVCSLLSSSRAMGGA